MSHELFRVTRASAAELDLAMAGVVFIAVVGLLFVLWLKRQDRRRSHDDAGKTRRPRPAGRGRRRR